MSKKKDNGSELDEKSDRIILQRIKEKSEDDFEKNITYVAAGALAISLTFLDKIVPVRESVQTFLVVLSWTLLVLTLLSNLLSHQYSSYIVDKTIDDVDESSEDSLVNWERRVKKIRIWNILNVLGLILGIGLFILFVSINITKSAGEKTRGNVKSHSTVEQESELPINMTPNSDSTNTIR